MSKTNRTLLPRSALTLVTVLACSGALAMPFCGSKGHKSGYRYAPVYAYPPMMPAYNYPPPVATRPHVHSWNRPEAQVPANRVPRVPAASPQSGS